MRKHFYIHTDPFNVISINILPAVVSCFFNVKPVTRSQKYELQMVTAVFSNDIKSIVAAKYLINFGQIIS
jgi:hypothetical protein